MKEFMLIIRCENARELAASLAMAAVEVQGGAEAVDALEVDSECPFPGAGPEPMTLVRCE